MVLKLNKSYNHNLSGPFSDLLADLQGVIPNSETLERIRIALIDALANPQNAEASPDQIELLLEAVDRGPNAFMTALRQLIAFENTQGISGELDGLGSLFSKIGTFVAKAATKVKEVVSKGKEVVAKVQPLLAQQKQQPVPVQYVPQQAAQIIPYQAQSTAPALPGVEKPDRTLLYVGLGVGGLLLMGGVIYFATRQRPVAGFDGPDGIPLGSQAAELGQTENSHLKSKTI